MTNYLASRIKTRTIGDPADQTFETHIENIKFLKKHFQFAMLISRRRPPKLSAQIMHGLLQLTSHGSVARHEPRNSPDRLLLRNNWMPRDCEEFSPVVSSWNDI